MEAPKDYFGPTIDAGSHRWRIVDYCEAKILPSYTCISYVWEDQRKPNPCPQLGPPEVSTYTQPALDSAISNFFSSDAGFWIDAYCIPVFDERRPVTRLDKQATLESMGFIYNNAQRVVVVLPSRSYLAMDTLIREMNERRKMRDVDQILHPKHLLKNLDNFQILEQDGWIKSVWTYQEVIGNNQIFFLSDHASQKPIPIWKALEALGDHQSIFRERIKGMSKFAMTQKYPHLDDFITLGGDWMSFTGGYALQVMANLDKRVAAEEKPLNYWYARIGAVHKIITTQPTDGSEQSLSSKFMDVCDEAGDFSYIFSAAPRESGSLGSKALGGRNPGSWRPVPVLKYDHLGHSHLELPSIVPHHSCGSKQLGTVNSKDGSLTLTRMAFYGTGRDVHLSSRTTHWFSGWNDREHHLGEAINDSSDGIINLELLGRRVFDFLHLIGFRGSEEYIVVEDGLFFPYNQIADPSGVEVLISTAIRYVFGAPGLVRMRNGKPAYSAGILVGEVDKNCHKCTIALN